MTEELERIESYKSQYREIVSDRFGDFYGRVASILEDFIAKGLEDGGMSLKAHMFIAERTLALLMGRVESAAEDVLSIPKILIEQERERYLEEGREEPLLKLSQPDGY